MTSVHPSDTNNRSAKYEKRTFISGETIFEAGTEPDGFYVLQSGRIEINTIAPDGRPIYIAHIKPGESFGEMSIVDQTTRNATAIANEPSVTHFFKRDILDRELNRAGALTFLFRNVCKKPCLSA